MNNKIALKIELGGLTREDLDLASIGIQNALTLIESQGYTDGEIHAGLSLAGAFIEACQKAIGKEGGTQ